MSRNLESIRKPFFDCGDLAQALGVQPASARVSASRYAAKGLILRVKRDLYVLRSRWEHMSAEERFALANLAQVPSYVSLTTALAYHEVSTQVQRDFIESITLRRTRTIEAGGATFLYSRISRVLYHGFIRSKGFFIATPEKALLDAAYLGSLGRYRLDWHALDSRKLDRAALRKLSAAFPPRTRRFLAEHGYTATA